MPTKVATTTALNDVVQVAGGQVTTCALTSAGAVFCWGAPTQVGNGGGSQVPCNGGPCVASPTWANVKGVAVEIAMGDEYAIARLADGSMMAWGGNGSGMIGNPQAMMPEQIMPLPVSHFP
jgi:alpha-tubulin suppressor-like RCC1 family protein